MYCAPRAVRVTPSCRVTPRSILNTKRTHLHQQQHRDLNLKPQTQITKSPCIKSVQQKFYVQTSTKPQAVPLINLSENFLDGTSAAYVEQMYDAWRKDPSSVHASWAAYFKNIENGLAPGAAFQLPPSSSRISSSSAPQQSGQVDAEQLRRTITDSMRLLLLVRAYQVRGHVLANIDPLGLTQNSVPPELELSTYGFTESDLDREFYVGDKLLSGFLSSDRQQVKLRDILKRLKETYCGSIGFEYMHIQDREMCNWLRDRIETPQQYSYNKEDKKVILDRLFWSTNFELFVAKKWGVAKRFGLDGCESLIPGIKALIDTAAELGVENVVMGMAHRGRLNTLANVVRKPLEAIFHEFAGKEPSEGTGTYTGSGDVKYHLGTSYDRQTRYGKKIHLSLLANPSHLEAVNPVVEGKARAKQTYLNDNKREKVMSLLIHGDASFAAQGIVYETIDFSGLPNYTTGGSVHVVINNQIGFTTDPKSSRASLYCTDVAKVSDAPIFHVNGDDPEAVVYVSELAAQWRQKFHKDVVIDIVCYRKFGHNEGDEPRFTQPLMYKQIDKMVPTLDQYINKLLKENVVTKSEIDTMANGVRDILEKAFKDSSSYKPADTDWFESVWKGFKKAQQNQPAVRPTALPTDLVHKIGHKLVDIPANFTLHKNVKQIIAARKQALETGEGVDWGFAEGLAVGSLLLEKNHVRISGQDVERGTFSHRHAVLHDQNTGETLIPLNTLSPDQAPFTITNSSLSEFGVLGFELGYSLENPNSLTIWEAQFGDFANGAQVMFDQFVSSGETKWRRQSGLTMLLPHGYDGSGPEHSSARLERFLQLSDSDPDVIPKGTSEEVIQKANWQVVNATTPANFFHALRRQVHRDFRKPMVVMSPKSLLKQRNSFSPLKNFTDGKFESVIADTHALVPDDQVSKILFCSGKVYYDLNDARNNRKINDIAIVRVEQVYPFPFPEVMAQIAKFPKAQVMWVQEEPKNMGSWNWIAPHLRTAGKGVHGQHFWPMYAGRPSSASPATGYSWEHKRELVNLINAALAPAK
eukprot:CAMPEP_0168557048 /NCGR_PEP_ID=MMETSP0413-20121227/9210_1 /TAXON_ID=136452 /ORGANISM="Filamoeba nolandi, Strain NC-AS-23-1" /LENGTH=1036 /DNA_ID=CAMNT_0008588039 /DNA_START=93 /DNA_END=3203 /DNA_ORIENTATION=+